MNLNNNANSSSVYEIIRGRRLQISNYVSCTRKAPLLTDVTAPCIKFTCASIVARHKHDIKLPQKDFTYIPPIFHILVLPNVIYSRYTAGNLPL